MEAIFYKNQPMKATFLRVSEGGKMAVTSQEKPSIHEYKVQHLEAIESVSYAKAMQSFSDSFIVVENPELVLNNAGKFFKPDQYKIMGREVPKVEDGLYPIQGLEFEVKEQCGCVNLKGPSEECKSAGGKNPYKCVRESIKLAIVSLVEPSKEVEKEPKQNIPLGHFFTIEDTDFVGVRGYDKTLYVIESGKVGKWQEEEFIKSQDTERLGEKTEWISVKERLPELDCGVLITDGETMVTAKMYEIEEFGPCWTAYGFGGYDWEWEINIADVTLWKPLPKLPTKD